MFYVLFTIVIAQRLGELVYARNNERYLKSLGGFEAGKQHYSWMLLMHISFFISLLVEYHLLSPTPPSWQLIPFLIFLIAQMIRYWAIRSLGPFWNTKIFVVPGMIVPKRGPYRWIRHPNYLAVIFEIISFPLMFGLFITAFVFSVLNLIMILYRVRVEEEALLAVTNYQEEMLSVPRFIPHLRKTLK